MLCDEHGLADIFPDVAIMFVDRVQDNAEGSDVTIYAVEQEPISTAKYMGSDRQKRFDQVDLIHRRTTQVILLSYSISKWDKYFESNS